MGASPKVISMKLMKHFQSLTQNGILPSASACGLIAEYQKTGEINGLLNALDALAPMVPEKQLPLLYRQKEKIKEEEQRWR